MKKLKCKDATLQKRIQEFCEGKGWTYKDFPCILAAAGIHHPIEVEQGEEYDIRVKTGEGIDYDVDLIPEYNLFTVRMETTNDVISKGFSLADKNENNGEIKAILLEIHFEVSSSSLICSLKENATYWQLDMLWPEEGTIVETYKFSATNRRANQRNTDESTRLINAFLLGLKGTDDFDKICKIFIDLMVESRSFNVSDFYSITHIMPNIYGDDQIKDMLIVANGEIINCVRTKGEERITIWQAGNWSYSYEKENNTVFKVEYNSKNDTYKYSLSGTLPEINKMESQKETIIKARLKAENLKKSVETKILL